jgi:para-aminobenzoate synthetase component 1
MKKLFKPPIEQVKRHLTEKHTHIPIAYPLDMDHQDWFSLYKQLTSDAQHHALLESGRAGRYSFFAYQPSHRLLGKERRLEIQSLETHQHGTEKSNIEEASAERTNTKTTGTKTTSIQEGELLSLVQEWMEKWQVPEFEELPDFLGGLLGFYSYDLVREIEELPSKAQDDLKTPDLYLLAFQQVVAYDHLNDQHWLLLYQPIENGLEKSYHYGKEKLLLWGAEMQEHLVFLQKVRQSEGQIKGAEQGNGNGKLEQNTSLKSQSPSTIKPSLSEKEFVKAVEAIQKYISAGDIFQVNLSVRQSRPLQSKPIDIYEELRKINPSPYMGFLHFPEMQIVSGSPEQLIKVKGKEVNTRPIAGTRSRGQDREEDLRLAKELIDNEKERAEHVMLVDLERNDLGKVCQFGSVVVDEFMVIEEYSHVMHIVSNVKGTLSPNQDAFDVIRAVFPGGTITGAPKVRTMEIIEELEPVRRGIYTGSIGWIDFNGNMELNIVIRTILALQGKAHVQAGAGIVIDSIPANEYKESLKKAAALWKAFEQSIQKKKELSV